jgi:predicted metal-dependent enzyme (double-stranded beta helix superfamily)
MVLVASTIGAEDLALGLLRDLLRNEPDLVARARRLTTFRGGRGWIRVADTADADAWLIAWSPGSSVGTHDHGGSHGAVHVLRGALVERYWESDDPSVRVRRLKHGATMSVPPDRVHDVANNDTRLALSLHVYSPRLATMSFYPPASSASG